MTKTKKMQTFFLILGLISAILVAISTFGYNYYSNLNNEESQIDAHKERKEIKEEVTDGSEKMKSILGSQDSVLTDLQKGQSDIKNEVKKSSKKKKPDINVQDSPNAIIQVNESGDNIVDKSVNIYEAKQRRVTEPMGKQLLKMTNSRLQKYGLGANGKIVVTTTTDAESRNFGKSIVKFLIDNNYNVYDGLNTYIGSDKGFENLDVAFKHNEKTQTLELWVNTLKEK